MKSLQATSLFYSDIATGGTSDKEYHIQVAKHGSGYVVNFQFGRRGGTLQAGTTKNTKEPVSLEEATREYEQRVNEKLSKGYVGAETSILPPIMPKASNGNSKTKFPVELLTKITREHADALLKSSKYWVQKKMDGHRRQLERKKDGSVVNYNKKGGPVAVLQEVAKASENLPWDTFLLDGELLGNVYYAFDLLEANGVSYADKKYADRFMELKTFRNSDHLKICPTWITAKAKEAGAFELYHARAEGLVFKRADATYKPGRAGQHFKFKFWKSATCKVTALGHKDKDNAIVALLKDGKWKPVGQASMIGKDKRIKVGSLVEVEFLYVGEGGRLVQPHIKPGPTGLRDDVNESECTFAQLKDALKEGIDDDEN